MKKRPHHRIEIKLRDISQLFNSMDPSPFNEKDLDHDAEEFIVSWVHEYPREDPISLVIYLQQWPSHPDPKILLEQAIHNYFAYRARLNWMEFKRLMKQGRTSLIIGLLFLSACLFGSEMLRHQEPGTFLSILRESLTIAGWVAMWRPMEIYLYEWWPLRRRGQIFDKMSHMHVELRKREEASPKTTVLTASTPAATSTESSMATPLTVATNNLPGSPDSSHPPQK